MESPSKLIYVIYLGKDGSTEKCYRKVIQR